ncbi:MAG: hypothetical protein AB8G15_15100 [Saprospiraceae bacterium]
MTKKNKAVVWFEKYFWDLSILNIVLFLAAYVLFEKSSVLKTILYVLAALPIIWMAISHDILHYKKVFLRFLGLAVVMMALGLLVNYTNNDQYAVLVSIGTKMSFCFLLLQKILRYGFVALWKREPEFRGAYWNLPNQLYTLVLSIGTLLLSLSEIFLEDLWYPH